MTRSKLIRILSEKQSVLSYKETENAVKSIFTQMARALEQGMRIEIRGFGSFSVRFRNPRQARNPRTGERFQKPGKHVPYFRAGKELRERVNLSAKHFPIKREEQDEP